jgi:DoxX-like family
VFTVHTAYVAVTVLTVCLNAAVAVADLVKARFVLATAGEVGVPRAWLPYLGALKAAGAAGLLLGLLGIRPLGIAAAVGLVLFFLGALGAHVRARVFHNIAFPAAFFVLAGATLTLVVVGG